jgi:hypothetical protein
MRRNEVRTRVALSNPANVSPTRIDNSSVANASSCWSEEDRVGGERRGVELSAYGPLLGV